MSKKTLLSLMTRSKQITEEHKEEEVKVEEVPHEMVNKFLDAGDISRNSKSF